jgi:hypothetical protein
MYALPPCQAVVFRLEAKSNSVPGPDESAIELHYEEPPDISILNDFQATQVSYAVTGALVTGQRYARGVITSDPELIAAANRVLARWFRNYQRSRSFMGRT